MHPFDLELLQCPSCRSGELQFAGQGQQNGLECCACGRLLEVVDGILCALPNGSETDSLAEREAKDKERGARDAQADDYDRMLGLKLFGAVEIPMTLRMVRPDVSETLVEVGCGTGRMTDAFAERSNHVVAIDFSMASLQRCREKLLRKGIQNVTLVQADATALPLKAEIGDKVVSCQVLEHVPTAEARDRMVGELARVAKNGAGVVVSAYKHSLLTKLFAKKEGEHEGGIYYYRFSRAELRDLMKSKLEVRSMTGALVYHYMVSASRAN